MPEILGRLPALLTGTGYLVTPVVALLRPPFTLRNEPDEVEEAFEYPLAAVARPRRAATPAAGIPRPDARILGLAA